MNEISKARHEKGRWIQIFRQQNQDGFTLIELLVVLGIASLLVGLMPAAYVKMQESAQYRSLLRGTVTDLRNARHIARNQGRYVHWRVNLEQRQQTLDGQSPKTIPSGVQVRATVGEQQLQQGIATITFLPDGGATGGSIEYIRSTGDGVRLRVDWLSGRVTQEKLLP